MNPRFWFVGMLAVLMLAVLVPGVVLAAKPSGFTAGGPVAVTYISDPIPAGASGRVRITTETLLSLGPLLSEDPALAGTYLYIQQKSNELFNSSDLSTALAVNGSSKGTFTVVALPHDVLAQGQYHLNVSNTPDCQIYSEGTWSTIVNHSSLKGRGTVTACLNFADPDGPGPLPPTFLGEINFIGTLN